MKFFRPATAEDFKDFEVEFNNHHSMDAETKSFIERGDIRRAINNLRLKYGFGLAEAKKYCKQYQAFAEAHRDFRQGLSVYVSYEKL